MMRWLATVLAPHGYWCDGDRYDCAKCGRGRGGWGHRLWLRYHS